MKKSLLLSISPLKFSAAMKRTFAFITVAMISAGCSNSNNGNQLPHLPESNPIHTPTPESDATLVTDMQKISKLMGIPNFPALSIWQRLDAVENQKNLTEEIAKTAARLNLVEMEVEISLLSKSCVKHTLYEAHAAARTFNALINRVRYFEKTAAKMISDIENTTAPSEIDKLKMKWADLLKSNEDFGSDIKLFSDLGSLSYEFVVKLPNDQRAEATKVSTLAAPAFGDIVNNITLLLNQRAADKKKLRYQMGFLANYLRAMDKQNRNIALYRAGQSFQNSDELKTSVKSFTTSQVVQSIANSDCYGSICQTRIDKISQGLNKCQ